MTDNQTTGLPWVSGSCEGEKCFCGEPAAAKIGEEIAHDDPMPHRHNLTSYVCAYHFAQIMGPMGERLMQRTESRDGDRVELDFFRQIAAAFVRLYPDDVRRQVEREVNMTVRERADIDYALAGQQVTFRPGFFARLQRMVAKYDNGR